MKTRLYVYLLAALFALLNAQASASPLKMFVFGDSLSDGGNMFALSGGLAPPSPPYAQVFSNDQVWVDQFADMLGLTTTNAYAAALTLQNPLAGDVVNLAVAGSYTGPQPYNFGDPATPSVAPSRNAIDAAVVAPLFPGLQGPGIPGISPIPGFDPIPSQLEFFNTLTGGVAPSDALYTIWAGANDFIFADSFFPPGTSAPSLVTSAVANIKMVIDDLAGDDLASSAAEDFLVFNMPDLGATPDAVRNGREAELTQASNEFNAALEAMLVELELTKPWVEITRLDVNTLFADLLSNPVLYGFDQTDQGPLPAPLASCIDDFSNPPERTNVFCAPGTGGDPDERIFWDSVHPTSAVHGIIAGAVYNAVPEPPVVLLMGISLIAFGAVRRRRTH
jgi:outer membrane lipase/esterase